MGCAAVIVRGRLTVTGSTYWLPAAGPWTVLHLPVPHHSCLRQGIKWDALQGLCARCCCGVLSPTWPWLSGPPRASLSGRLPWMPLHFIFPGMGPGKRPKCGTHAPSLSSILNLSWPPPSCPTQELPMLPFRVMLSGALCLCLSLPGTPVPMRFANAPGYGV